MDEKVEISLERYEKLKQEVQEREQKIKELEDKVETAVGETNYYKSLFREIFKADLPIEKIMHANLTISINEKFESNSLVYRIAFEIPKG